MASAQQRRAVTEPVTCTFPVSWPVAATVTVTVEPHGRNVHLTYVVPDRTPKVSSMSLGPITMGIVMAVVAAIARVQAGAAQARPAAP
ncbi:hypothetical protein [Mangrovihabitans endophyticus]|uniref:Uncharacterized protein n=1 Tax=Mangrovihabitans endophyticus TaxID=1751298 RepID=A0A8J3C5P8_9ACTN|nr:hypothetical protein [Mangrovihabitans endophyticus]GGL11979.1 hypothetical protein GCM10012284_53400 [Mangrovihabitans endophyticus]